jgi:hypothetical protein
MGFIRWLKAYNRRRSGGIPARDDLRLPSDLRLVRLYRAVRDFPGRTEADLARIIYGRPDPFLVEQDGRMLETAGMIARDPATGRLHVT